MTCLRSLQPRLAAQSLAARVHEKLNADAWMKAPELKQAICDAKEALLARMWEELRAVEPVQRRKWKSLAARTQPNKVEAEP